jgi:hypothetical protein
MGPIKRKGVRNFQTGDQIAILMIRVPQAKGDFGLRMNYAFGRSYPHFPLKKQRTRRVSKLEFS